MWQQEKEYPHHVKSTTSRNVINLVKKKFIYSAVTSARTCVLADVIYFGYVLSNLKSASLGFGAFD